MPNSVKFYVNEIIGSTGVLKVTHSDFAKMLNFISPQQRQLLQRVFSFFFRIFSKHKIYFIFFRFRPHAIFTPNSRKLNVNESVGSTAAIK